MSKYGTDPSAAEASRGYQYQFYGRANPVTQESIPDHDRLDVVVGKYSKKIQMPGSNLHVSVEGPEWLVGTKVNQGMWSRPPKVQASLKTNGFHYERVAAFLDDNPVESSMGATAVSVAAPREFTRVACPKRADVIYDRKEGRINRQAIARAKTWLSGNRTEFDDAGGFKGENLHRALNTTMLRRGKTRMASGACG